MMALTMAFVGEVVPKARLWRAMSLLGTMSAIGNMLGPSFGGILIASAGWPGDLPHQCAAGCPGLSACRACPTCGGYSAGYASPRRFRLRRDRAAVDQIWYIRIGDDNRSRSLWSAQVRAPPARIRRLRIFPAGRSKGCGSADSMSLFRGPASGTGLAGGTLVSMSSGGRRLRRAGRSDPARGLRLLTSALLSSCFSTHGEREGVSCFDGFTA